MQFGLRRFLLLFIWLAAGMAGFSLGGVVAMILNCVFLGFAFLIGCLTVEAWPTLRQNEKRVGVFATVVSLAGFLFFFLALGIRSSSG